MAKVKDFLRKDFPVVSPRDSLEDIISRILNPGKEETSSFVVLDAEGRLVGVISTWLVLRALAIGAEKEEEPAVDSLMKKRTKLPVASAMAEEFPVANPEDDLFSALAVLELTYFDCLPVVKGETYLGAVRTIEIFQTVSEDILGGASGGVFSEG